MLEFVAEAKEVLNAFENILEELDMFLVEIEVKEELEEIAKRLWNLL